MAFLTPPFDAYYTMTLTYVLTHSLTDVLKPYMASEVFKDFDYVAAGHIHSPQKAGRETIRYCGSPLKYSVSEEKNIKSVTVIELKEKGDISIDFVQLHPLHDVKCIKGSFEQLMQSKPTEDYVAAIVTDEEIRPDAGISIRAVFPNMISFSVENSRMREIVSMGEEKQIENKSALEIFREFYAFRNGGNEPNAEQIKIMSQIFSGEDEAE